MSSHQQHIELPSQEQLDRLLNEQWAQEILPRLPAALEEQARALGAFVRKRQVRGTAELLRALLVYALCGLSFRGLGCWAVLTGIGSLSEKAWRKRLQRAAGWISWLLGALIATTQRPAWLPEGIKETGIVLVDFSSIKLIGGTGDDLRLHLGYDLLAGRMDHVVVSDQHQAESIPVEVVRRNWMYVSDSGYRQRYVAVLMRALRAGGGPTVWPRPASGSGKCLGDRCASAKVGLGRKHQPVWLDQCAGKGAASIRAGDPQASSTSTSAKGAGEQRSQSEGEREDAQRRDALVGSMDRDRDDALRRGLAQ